MSIDDKWANDDYSVQFTTKLERSEWPTRHRAKPVNGENVAMGGDQAKFYFYWKSSE